eukprot:1464802-Rhodomonas_salina.1
MAKEHKGSIDTNQTNKQNPPTHTDTHKNLTSNSSNITCTARHALTGRVTLRTCLDARLQGYDRLGELVGAALRAPAPPFPLAGSSPGA